MVLDAPSIAGQARPGQFLHVRCSESYDPLLRRPFSVHRINESSVEILYQVVGKGTEVLSRRKAGGELSILGPLGNGFSIDEEDSTAILVAGGIGIAPLVALAERLAHSQQPTVHSKKKVYFLIGARTKELILYEEEFQKLGMEVRVSTEDRSYGQRGMVTELLKDLLGTGNWELGTIYACGPKDMLKEVAKISKSFGARTQASLEENMGCGVGACLGCVVKMKRSEARGQKPDERTASSQAFIYKRVCTDGPIFDLDSVVWE